MSVELLTHFLNSVISLLLFWSWVIVVSSIFWTLASYSDTKFANKSSHSIGCLFILLVVKETVLFSLGNFRALATIIWPHVWIYLRFPSYGSLVSLLILLPVGHCFDCYGIIMCFESRKPEVTIVVLYSQDWFLSLDFFWVPEVLYFRIFFPFL